MYHQLDIIGSCIVEHRSHYSFDIIMSMGMPTSSIYMSHIICISPIDGSHINTKTKIHHDPALEAPPLCSKSYDVRWPYVELLPSHIRGQSINPKNPAMSSARPTPPKDIHARPSFDPHTLIKAQKYEKGLKKP